MLTVYSTGPQCQKCNLTKSAFDKAGIAYKPVDLASVPDTHPIRRHNHTTAPIVVDELTGDEWSDFRPDRIRAAIIARGVNP